MSEIGTEIAEKPDVEVVEEKKKRRGKPTRPDVVRTAERRAFTLQLRAKGLTYRAIEAEVRKHFGDENLPDGYSYRRAYKDVKAEMDKLRDQIKEESEAVLYLELQRLDAMLEGVWERAQKGNTNAIETVLKIMQRRSKLLGLDKPTKMAQTDPEGLVALPRDIIIVKEYLESKELKMLSPGENGDE